MRWPTQAYQTSLGCFLKHAVKNLSNLRLIRLQARMMKPYSLRNHILDRPIAVEFWFPSQQPIGSPVVPLSRVLVSG